MFGFSKSDRKQRGKKKQRRFDTERLETRACPAGIVTIIPIGPDLLFVGDNDPAGNEIDVQEIAAGTNIYSVTGKAGTLLSGPGIFGTVPQVTLGGAPIRDFDFDMNDGPDNVHLLADPSGVDSVFVRDVTFLGDDKADTFETDGVSIGRNLSVTTHGGDDVVDLNLTTVGRVTRIDTGADNDDVDILDSDFTSNVRILTRAGHDAVTVDSTLAGVNPVSEFFRDFNVNTGAGKDDVDILDSDFYRDFTVMTGAGRDDVNLELNYFYGVGRTATIDTAWGNDAVTLSAGNLFTAGGGSVTTVIDTGTGWDDLTSSNNLYYVLDVDLGDHDDDAVLSQDDFAAAGSDVDGGTGTDTYTAVLLTGTVPTTTNIP
jgi:hypothetical protein